MSRKPIKSGRVESHDKSGGSEGKEESRGLQSFSIFRALEWSEIQEQKYFHLHYLLLLFITFFSSSTAADVARCAFVLFFTSSKLLLA